MPFSHSFPFESSKSGIFQKSVEREFRVLIKHYLWKINCLRRINEFDKFHGETAASIKTISKWLLKFSWRVIYAQVTLKVLDALWRSLPLTLWASRENVNVCFCTNNWKWKSWHNLSAAVANRCTKARSRNMFYRLMFQWNLQKFSRRFIFVGLSNINLRRLVGNDWKQVHIIYRYRNCKKKNVRKQRCEKISTSVLFHHDSCGRKIDRVRGFNLFGPRIYESSELKNKRYYKMSSILPSQKLSQ